jgi:hypothetical protein
MRISLLFLILFVGASAASAQVVYHATKSSPRINNSPIKPPFKPLAIKTTVTIYNNALVVRGDRDLNLKLVRKINVIDKDGSNYTHWNALDSQGEACTIIMKDYVTYSKIGIFWNKNGAGVVYETL